MTELTTEQKAIKTAVEKDIKEHYFLLKKHSFIFFLGGMIMFVFTAGFLTYQTAITAAKSVAKEQAQVATIQEIEAMHAQATSLLASIYNQNDAANSFVENMSSEFATLRNELDQAIKYDQEIKIAVGSTDFFLHGKPGKNQILKIDVFSVGLFKQQDKKFTPNGEFVWQIRKP